jgi:ubiquitin-conjugating enzyme E2 Z
MSPNPYENEPGFEDSDEKDQQKAYADKIRHETLRVAVVQRLEEYLNLTPPSIFSSQYRGDSDDETQPYKDLCKRRFLWYYENYLKSVDEQQAEYRDGTPFPTMAFEGTSNTMDGIYVYSKLHAKLVAIKAALDKETANWAAEGLLEVQKEHPFASQLRTWNEAVVDIYSGRDDINVDVTLAEDNPFVWQLVLFGGPSTILDGGIVKIRICISPRFPDEQPRVFVETPIFHHRVAKDGTLCYVLRENTSDIKKHVEAILESLLQEQPSYDPRTLVNVEASKLYWGSADEKKMYNRKLRRSLQDSAE